MRSWCWVSLIKGYNLYIAIIFGKQKIMGSIEKLKDVIESGLVSDIFRMERAYYLYKEIGNNADRLNAWEYGNYGDFFGAVQKALATEAALAVARVFDPPNPKFPTRCLIKALDILESDSDINYSLMWVNR
jgi:hypothetical protein